MNVILGGYIGLQHADQVLLSALIYLTHNYYNNNRSLSINSCAWTLWRWPDITSLFYRFHRHQDWKVTPAGMDFIKRFQNYNRTMKTSSTGKVTWCSKAVDDTGYYSPQFLSFSSVMYLHLTLLTHPIPLHLYDPLTSTGRSVYNYTIPGTRRSTCLGIDPLYFRPIDIDVYTGTNTPSQRALWINTFHILTNQYNLFLTHFLNPFSTIEPVAYVYDAVSASVGAVVAHQQSQQQPGTQLNFPADIEGDAIANSMAVSNFTVMGVTGSVQFETGIGGIPDYGWVSDPP